MGSGTAPGQERGDPFVVAVASEKGGVGKTTIATNLAVYLKALREDLPVTIASFDNHFSVDGMFAIGAQRGMSVAGLFAGSPPEELATLGEYGVAYLASDRELAPPDADPLRLRRVLEGSRLGGILILDTRPILDVLTRNALLAADLVLVPVKDRASLVNAAAVRAELAAVPGAEERLWLVPSLIDGRLRLRDDLGMRDFLVGSARERGYRVLESGISKSPKVESLATNLCARVYPVLTHARSTQVHRQFRDLADFVLERLAERPALRSLPAARDDRPGSALLRMECPLCGERRPGYGHPVMTLRRRRRGGLHATCLAGLLAALEPGPLPATGLLVAYCGDGEDSGLQLQLIDAADEDPFPDTADAGTAERWRRLAAALAGIDPAELFREGLLIQLEPAPPEAAFAAGPARRRFAARRRRALEWLAELVR